MKKIHLIFLIACALSSILFSGCFPEGGDAECNDTNFKIQPVTVVDDGVWSMPFKETLNPEAVQFINQNLGYSLIYDQSFNPSFQRTTDGGKSWVTVGNAVMSSFHFTSASIGYSTSGGSILKTIDSGSHWSVVDSSGPSSAFKAIYFPNMTTGYAITGYRGSIIKTSDGGSSWTLLSAPISAYPIFLNSVFFANADTGYVLGDSGLSGDNRGRLVLKTVDGGNKWTQINIPLAYGTTATYDLNSVYFTDANTGWIVGSVYGGNIDTNTDFISGANLGGIILKTTNGGINWAVQDSGAPFDLHSVTFINSTTGYAVGGGSSHDTYSYLFSQEGCSTPVVPYYSQILKTTDGGAHWLPEKIFPQTDYSDPLLSVSCTTSGFCAAAGNDGIWIRNP